MNYQDLTKEQVQELKVLLENAERTEADNIVFEGKELDLEYANLLYAVCINEEHDKINSKE